MPSTRCAPSAARRTWTRALPRQRSSASPSVASSAISTNRACASPHPNDAARSGPFSVGRASSMLIAAVVATRSPMQLPISSRSDTAAARPENPSFSRPAPASLTPTSPYGVSSRIRASATSALMSGSANGLPDGGGSILSISPSTSLPSTSRPRSRTCPARMPVTSIPPRSTRVCTSTQSATRSGAAGSPITRSVSR